MQEPLPEESTIDLVRIEALLGNLPAEIRRHVPFTLEYDEPKALVHTSPVYHQQYLLDCQRLLCKCLEANLGSVTTDTCAVHQSSSVQSPKTRTEDTITRFLELYRYHHLSQLRTLTLDEVISMMTFHFLITKPFTQHYTG